MKIVGGITAVGVLVGMSFTAYLFIEGKIDASATGLQKQMNAAQLADFRGDVEFEIYKIQHKLDEIERREENGKSYSTDSLEKRLLIRQLNIMLQRKSEVVQRIESETK